jgi:hypothetical protein
MTGGAVKAWVDNDNSLIMAGEKIELGKDVGNLVFP